MFNPLGAFSSFGQGATEGYTDPKLMNQIGMQALGKALFQQQPQVPMAPPPGQASMPSQPPQAAPQQADAPMPPEMQSAPMAAQGGVMGASSAAPPQQGQGMPGGGQQAQPVAMPPQGGVAGQGMDLQSLIGRIRNANPGIPPQAMMAALNHAMPILNLQARDQLLSMRREMYGLSAPLRNRAMDLRQQELDLRTQRLGGKGGGAGGQPPPEAVNALQEGHVTTFGNGQQWTLQNGQPTQVGGPQSGVSQGQPGEGGGQAEGGGQGGEQTLSRRPGAIPAPDWVIEGGEQRRGLSRRPGQSAQDNTLDNSAPYAGNYNPMQQTQPAAETRRYRGPEIPMEEFDKQQLPPDPFVNPDPYAGNLSPQEASQLRLRLRLPQTIDEFRRHFGRDPSTDSEMDAYSDQMGGKAPYSPGMDRGGGRNNLRRRTGPLYE